MFALVAASLVIAPSSSSPTDDANLSLIAKQAADSAVAKFAPQKVTAEQLGITILQLQRSSNDWKQGTFQGDTAMYPASVVKLFFLAYLQQQLQDRKARLTPELNRAMTDMIVESSNDATALVVDTSTGTTGGPELSPRELKTWMAKRQAVNRWFTRLGYPTLNACQKTWNEGSYGRERQGYGPKMELRNSLSPNVCARLMAEIALNKIVTPDRCAEMRKLLSRVIVAEGEADYQSKAFTGSVVPKGTKLFSKAGYTSTVRHDVAYIVAPDSREFVMAIFTKDQSETLELIPSIAKTILQRLAVLP